MIFLTSRERLTLGLLAGCAVIGIAANVARARWERVTAQVVHPAASAPLDEALAATRRVSLNTATAAELERLPGIGPSLAARIVAYRKAHGPFASLDELRRVDGIGATLLAQLRDVVTP